MHVRLDRILVPTDLSPLGDQAVAYAIALAPPGATLHLLHVLEPAPTPNPFYAHFQRGTQASEQDLGVHSEIDTGGTIHREGGFQRSALR